MGKKVKVQYVNILVWGSFFVYFEKKTHWWRRIPFIKIKGVYFITSLTFYESTSSCDIGRVQREYSGVPRE